MAHIYDCTKGYSRSTYVTLYCEGMLPPHYPVPVISGETLKANHNVTCHCPHCGTVIKAQN